MAVSTFPLLVQESQFVYSFKSLVRTRRIIHEILVPYIPEFQRERERERERKRERERERELQFV